MTRFLTCIFLIFARAASRGKKTDIVRGYILLGFFLMSGMATLEKMFSKYVYPVDQILSSCCSFGEMNTHNPFSAKGIPMTLIVFPLVGLMLWWGLRNRKRIANELDSEKPVVGSRILAILLLVIAVGIGFFGTQGDGNEPLFALASFGLELMLLWALVGILRPKARPDASKC